MTDFQEWLKTKSYNIRLLTIAFGGSHERFLHDPDRVAEAAQFGPDALEALHLRVREDAQTPPSAKLVELAEDLRSSFEQVRLLVKKFEEERRKEMTTPHNLPTDGIPGDPS